MRKHDLNPALLPSEWRILKSVAAVFFVGLLALMVYSFAQEEHAFRTMTPAQHLSAARGFLAAKSFDYGLDHLAAIGPGTAEAAEAKALGQELRTQKEIAEQEQAANRQAAQLAEQSRESAVQSLEARLHELGYDLTVARSDNVGEIVITSKDFSETDQRVKFLSFLRGRNSPAMDVCLAGFQTVRLKAGSISLLAFSEAYSLDCFNRK